MSKAIVAATTGALQNTAQRSLLELLGSTFQAAYEPNHVSPPVIEPKLTELPTLERIAEVFRYKTLRLEYELSSNGGLRAYIKLIMLTSFLLGIPAILIVPIITSIFGQFVTWSAYLLQAVQNILYTLLSIVATMVIIWVVMLLLGRHR